MLITKAQLDKKIAEIYPLSMMKKMEIGKEKYENLHRYFTILIGDEKVAHTYVEAFAFIFAEADKKINEKEFNFLKKVIKVKGKKEDLEGYIEELNKKEYLSKSLDYVSRSGNKLVDDALTLAICLLTIDGTLNKDERNWIEAIFKKMNAVEY